MCKGQLKTNVDRAAHAKTAPTAAPVGIAASHRHRGELLWHRGELRWHRGELRWHRGEHIMTTAGENSTASNAANCVNAPVLHDFMLLMHNDTASEPPSEMWDGYFSFLHASQHFEGGSEIGSGATFRKPGSATPGSTSDHLTGFIRVRASSLADAQRFLAGNPVYECGGTVEIRELPKS